MTVHELVNCAITWFKMKAPDYILIIGYDEKYFSTSNTENNKNTHFIVPNNI